MIANCNIMGKPIIITRLVDTMSSSPRPTRCALDSKQSQHNCVTNALQCAHARRGAAASFDKSTRSHLHAVARPRAEATDVANAVMDGADAFLLGAETLRGVHPVLTIATILSIARQAEAVFDHTHHFDHLMTVRLLPPFTHSSNQGNMAGLKL
jgi:pyruvate kinase